MRFKHIYIVKFSTDKLKMYRYIQLLISDFYEMLQTILLYYYLVSPYVIKLFYHLQLFSSKVSRDQPPRDWSNLLISPPISVILYKCSAASAEIFESKILVVLLTKGSSISMSDRRNEVPRSTHVPYIYKKIRLYKLAIA